MTERQTFDKYDRLLFGCSGQIIAVPLTMLVVSQEIPGDNDIGWVLAACAVVWAITGGLTHWWYLRALREEACRG